MPVFDFDIDPTEHRNVADFVKFGSLTSIHLIHGRHALQSHFNGSNESACCSCQC